MKLVLSPVSVVDDDSIEIVERKGLGHPDTICDALAENLSRMLCREYRRKLGHILHHNVDKALLCGGRANPAFGGGVVLAPISIYLAGRAVMEVAGVVVAVEELAVEASRAWLRSNLHALDAERDVKLHTLIRPGSQDLRDLFARGATGNLPLAQRHVDRRRLCPAEPARAARPRHRAPHQADPIYAC